MELLYLPNPIVNRRLAAVGQVAQELFAKITLIFQVLPQNTVSTAQTDPETGLLYLIHLKIDLDLTREYEVFVFSG